MGFLRAPRDTSPAAAGPDQVQHGQAGHEHPLPLDLARHPHRGLVAAHHAGLAHLSRYRSDGGTQLWAGTGQDVAQRAFADGQAEHLAHQRARPLQSDRVDIIQGDHHGPDAAAERRAGFQLGRCVSIR